VRRLEEQTGCGNPEADTTSGLVAYLDGQPIGWCAVEPRTQYEGLLRVFRVPWEGREEDKADDTVWAVTCLFARAGFRRRGVSRALAQAAVAFARERGARAIEAYPIITKSVIAEELHVGTPGVFSDAGLIEVARPSLRRVVMRLSSDHGSRASHERTACALDDIRYHRDRQCIAVLSGTEAPLGRAPSRGSPSPGSPLAIRGEPHIRP
jgi:GNAT superfamily N-acetyltransferase